MLESLSESTLKKITGRALKSGGPVSVDVMAPAFIQGFELMFCGSVLFNLQGSERMRMAAIPTGDKSVSVELFRSNLKPRPALQYSIGPGETPAECLNWFLGMLDLANDIYKVTMKDGVMTAPNMRVQMPRSRIRAGFDVAHDPADDTLVTVDAVPHAVSSAFQLDFSGMPKLNG